MRDIELLAPAKNYACAITAIKCGADAVYVGAPKFSARAEAGISLEEIERLTREAHLYGVKVYVALNTILFDDELTEAQHLVEELWEAGVDALIVQDMAFAKMTLPPIALHASTQTANFTTERVRFLQEVGFQRVVLERALSLEEIRTIHRCCQTELECFIHGAICVSYSGQCYMSQVVAERSGNRGVCSQPCRSTYNLYSDDGTLLLRNKHLLSVKDLSLDQHLVQLIDSGVCSLKIEGRLKDEQYIKNVVMYYNRILNKIIAHREDLRRSSNGTVCCDFLPNPAKSFNRGFTSYFIDGKQTKVANFETGKAIGEKIGTVQALGRDFLTLSECAIPLANGDGVCLIRAGAPLVGAQINKVDGNKIFLNKMEGVVSGAVMYRNADKRFADQLAATTPRRMLDVDLYVRFEQGTIYLTALTDNYMFDRSFDGFVFEAAQDKEKARKTFIEQLSKSGNSCFRMRKIHANTEIPFFPISTINTLRRTLFEQLEEHLITHYQRAPQKPLKVVKNNTGVLSYNANITNHLARSFYLECGYNNIEQGIEATRQYDGIEVMRTKYCLRHEVGICLKESKEKKPLFLENNGKRFDLEFDCARCEMIVRYRK